MRKSFGALKALAIGLMAATGAFPAPVLAGDGPVVVELYTSQGCSSCPPADAYLAERLVGRKDVLALALHVDIWDYIGWKDKFGAPEYTARQRAYAARAGHRSIYTPQFIVGGRDHVVGHKPTELANLIAAHRAGPDMVEISATSTGGALAVSITALSAAKTPREMIVLVALYNPGADVAIKRGENAGRTIRYANIVTDLIELGAWDGRGPFAARLEGMGSRRAAVIVQGAGTGPVIGASYVK
ncbi:MAG: hypothetical protein ACJA06_002572 [Halocynthiibacter sp.]|jgi:hypothetical protein